MHEKNLDPDAHDPMPQHRVRESVTYHRAVVTVADVRPYAMTLPRTTEAFVGGRVEFRVGRLVYLSFSRDAHVMGFAFPKEERDWLIGGSPDKSMHASIRPPEPCG